MCGRYALHASPEVIALQFELGAAPEFMPSYNIRPGARIVAVTAGRAAELHHWGLGGRLANARAETVEQKFPQAFRRRCLVPASGYYEWRTSGGRQYPWYIHPLDAQLFGLAAISALWHGRPALSLITTTPNATVQSIYDRMPAIVAREDYAAWLDPGNRDARALLGPYAPARMTAHPVSTRVNKPENDDAALIEASEGPPQRDLL